MPIYEYQCGSCAHQFETMQKVSEAVLTDCPECGKSALKKLVSRVAFRLKGSGWYETDFKSGNKRNVADSGKSAASAGDSTSSSASDASSSKSDSSSKDDSAASSSEKGEKKSEKKSDAKKKGNDHKAA